MIRRIIHIDEKNATDVVRVRLPATRAQSESVDGKAKLLRDDYCDGLGDCLPACPTGAITFVEREAAAYDEEAVLANQRKKAGENKSAHHMSGGCPGSRMRQMKRETTAPTENEMESQLQQWPVQIKLVPTQAPYFEGAKLLIAADCTAYAYANFHQDFIRGKVVLVGCPKLDSVDYSEKLEEIIQSNNISSMTVVRMEVPCCGGLEMAAKKALQNSGKFIPWQVVTISVDGKILD